MVKGKPWNINEIRQLNDLVAEGKNVEEISKLMDKTLDSIKQKMFDLKLKENREEKRVGGGTPHVFSSSPKLPVEIFTMETTLKKICAAMTALETPGLEKSEIFRLKGIISGAKVCKETLAEYNHYCELEERLIELEGKYESRCKKSKTNGAK